MIFAVLLAACAHRSPDDDAAPSAPSDTDSDAPTDTTDLVDAPTAEVLAGSFAGEPIIGDQWVMVYGPQGGYHVWASLTLCGLGNLVRYSLDLYDDRSGAWLGGAVPDREGGRQNVGISMRDEQCGVYTGIQARFFDASQAPADTAAPDTDEAETIQRPPELYAGCPLRLRLTAWNLDDSMNASAEALGIAEVDPVNVGPGGVFIEPASGDTPLGVIGGCTPVAP